MQYVKAPHCSKVLCLSFKQSPFLQTVLSWFLPACLLCLTGSTCQKDAQRILPNNCFSAFWYGANDEIRPHLYNTSIQVARITPHCCSPGVKSLAEYCGYFADESWEGCRRYPPEALCEGNVETMAHCPHWLTTRDYGKKRQWMTREIKQKCYS